MSTTTLQPSTQNLSQRVEDLNRYLQQGRILEAMQEFYAPNVSMQENNNPPTVGLEANIEREKQFVGMIKEWKGLEIQSVGLDQARNRALIQVSFEFVNQENQTMKFDQVAVQTWRDGKIVNEKFYYNAGK